MSLLLEPLRTAYKAIKRSLTPQQHLFYGFLAYVLAGTILLRLPWLQKTSAPLLDHLFIAVSAVSTTGLVTMSVFDTYNFGGQLVILALFQIGGIGYLVFTTFLLLSTTRKMTAWHKSVLNTEFKLPETINIRDFLRSVVFFTLIMEALGAVLFFMVFKTDGVEIGEAIWLSIFHSVSAFCTAGFSLFDNSFIDYIDNSLVNFTISMLTLCGSLGFIVITDFGLLLRRKKHHLTFTTKIVTIGSLILLTAGFLFFYFGEPVISNLEGSARVSAAFFQSMTSMTTVGFYTVDVSTFILPILLVTIFLMYVGASPSGTAGGMKITTLTAILAILNSRLKGYEKIKFFGKEIPIERLYVATAAFIFYTVLISLGTFFLTFSEDFQFEALLFEVASALGTVGLTTGITPDLSVFGKIVLIILMFIGRLGVLTFGLAVWSTHIQAKKEQTSENDLAV